MKKAMYFGLIGVLALICAKVLFFNHTVVDTKTYPSSNIEKPEGKVIAFWQKKAEEKQVSPTQFPEPSSPVVSENIKLCNGGKPCPWIGIQKLTTEERERFDKKAAKAARYFMLWGKFANDEQRDDFIATVLQLGDRGLAEYARELDSLGETKTHITDEESKAAIMKIDLLQTLAKRKQPTAMKMVEALATRFIPLDANGHVLKDSDTHGSYVTLENFEIFSQSAPEKAAAFINAIPKREHRYPYAYHYFVGKKLAGLSPAEAKVNAELAFGKEVMQGLGLPD